MVLMANLHLPICSTSCSSNMDYTKDGWVSLHHCEYMSWLAASQSRSNSIICFILRFYFNGDHSLHIRKLLLRSNHSETVFSIQCLFATTGFPLARKQDYCFAQELLCLEM